MQHSASTIGRFCRKGIHTTLLKWIGAGALLLAATTALWPNPRAEAAALRMGPPKSLMRTCLVTITVDGFPGVVINELLTLHEDGGYSAAFNQLIPRLTPIPWDQRLPAVRCMEIGVGSEDRTGSSRVWRLDICSRKRP
jgi:hypothetical protein